VVVHAEYSRWPLFGSQRLQVGGPYTVRGFRDQSLIGERGGYLRNDLVLPLPWASLEQQGGRSELYLGLDSGWAAPAVSHSTASGGVAGTALGIRNSSGPISMDTSIGHALYGPLKN
jgi:hemolysin activation/secretion protein